MMGDGSGRVVLAVRAVAFGAVAFGAVACSIKSETAPSNFYMLHALTVEAAPREGGSAASDLALAIGPVQLPAYLDRPQIVTRGSGNDVTLSEFDRWAEPLRDNITGVLADNLSRLVPTQRVSRYPAVPSADSDLRVTVEIIRFDGAPAGEVLLDARWSLIAGDATAPLQTQRSGISQPVAGSGLSAVVAAMNRAVDSLSREIAAGVRRAADR